VDYLALIGFESNDYCRMKVYLYAYTKPLTPLLVNCGGVGEELTELGGEFIRKRARNAPL
jgi:hypothetical protein